MIELIIGHAGKLLCFFNREATEITHFMTKKNIMLFITRFFRCVRRKYKTFSYFLDIFIVLLVKIKCSGYAVRFIQMIYFGFETYLIEQFSTTNAKQNKLRHLRRNIRIIKTMCDRL